MVFTEFIKWAKDTIPNWKEFQTLGSQSRFFAKYNYQENSIRIRNSRGNEHEINEDDLQRIFERYVNATAQTRNKASHYTDPMWPETPNRVFAPCIPAIIKFWAENMTRR